MSDILKVDLWSDSACPWCYVGKRRFEEGVRRYHERGGNRTVQVEYHSFELAPDTPVDFQGSEVDFLAGYKGIPVARRTASQACRSSPSTSGTASRGRKTPACSRGPWLNRPTSHRSRHDGRTLSPLRCWEMQARAEAKPGDDLETGRGPGDGPGPLPALPVAGRSVLQVEGQDPLGWVSEAGRPRSHLPRPCTCPPLR
jgi:DSBA-like thioredoxin domain